MPTIAVAAALGASLCWALGSLIAHRPATQFGAFEFTRTRLISSFALLIVIVTALNGWQSVTWVHWPSFMAASLIGVVFTNLAMIACLRRGGPQAAIGGGFAPLIFATLLRDYPDTYAIPVYVTGARSSARQCNFDIAGFHSR